MILPAAGHASIIPGFIREQVEEIKAEGGLHLPSPMSPVGWRDNYTIEVSNEKNISTVEIYVFIPLGFTLISLSDPEGWASSVTEDNRGEKRVVIWNGSSIPPMETGEFELTLDNPSGLSERHIFRILQIYEDESQNIWIVSMVTIFPPSIAGVEFFTLGYSAVAISLILPILETAITRLRKIPRL